MRVSNLFVALVSIIASIRYRYKCSTKYLALFGCKCMNKNDLIIVYFSLSAKKNESLLTFHFQCVFL